MTTVFKSLEFIYVNTRNIKLRILYNRYIMHMILRTTIINDNVLIVQIRYSNLRLIQHYLNRKLKI